MGIKERKEREKQQRRMDIVDAAETVFFSKGYDNSTMDDIASKAELAKGTLYLYFNTKSEICLSIAVRGLILLRKALESSVENSRDAIDTLRGLLGICLNFQKEHPNYTRALIRFRDFIEQCHDESDMLNLARDENEVIVGLIISLIRNGKKEKRIRADIDADALARSLWGQMSGFLPNQAFERTEKQQSTGSSDESFTEHAEYLYDLIIQGITC